jgi:hypothetical protein
VPTITWNDIPASVARPPAVELEPAIVALSFEELR